MAVIPKDQLKATASQKGKFVPQIIWKYGWRDGARANTLGSAKNHDSIPFGTSYISTGYVPSDMSNAYGFNLIPPGGNGTGQQIWIVDAYGSPSIQSDLNTFCVSTGLARTTVNVFAPYGAPPVVDSGWAAETTLDVEWAHAMAPGATINLVVTPDAQSTLYSAVAYATARGAKIVSMSWGSTNEAYGMSNAAAFPMVAPIAYVAAAGDYGYGVSWPGAQTNVLSVGGTRMLYNRAIKSVVSETGWSWFYDGLQYTATGGGVSQVLAKPLYQRYFSGYTNRAVPDVSYNADPYSGVSVYFTDPSTGVSGWQVVGGTSAGAPQWAALLACHASLGNTNLSQITQQMYYLASKPNSANYPNYFKDITSGNNGFPAKLGYDLMTGLGSPVANAIATSTPAPSPTPGPTASPSPNPVPVPPAPPIIQQWGAVPGSIPDASTNGGVKAISLGAGNPDNSSALNGSGQVVVWGFGSCTNVPSAASNGVSAISLGYAHMMALQSGTVLAWGDNTTGATDVPAGLTNVVAISAGWWSGLALISDGTVAAWGNKYTYNTAAYHDADLITVAANGLIKVIGISDGYNQALILLADGTVLAFGNSFTTAASAESDVPVGLIGVVAISEGRDFALALKSNGTVVAWGDNSLGQCNVPKGLTGVIAISAGGFHALALKSDGTVVAWGDNSTGQSIVPAGLGKITAVEAGRYHSMSSTEGVGDSQTSGSGGGGGGGGLGTRPLPAPRTTPTPIVIPTSTLGGSLGTRPLPAPRSVPAPL